MERDPFESFERDGDVISGADFESLEQVGWTSPEERAAYEEALLEEEATRAAKSMVVETSAEQSEVGSPASSELDSEDAREEMLLQAAESKYDRLADLVETRADQGVDTTALQIEMTVLEREVTDRRQHLLNRRRVRELRQADHERRVAEIEQITDPVKRERAMRELLAKERAAEERRGRRY